MDSETEDSAAQLWTDEAALLRRMPDATFEFVRTAYVGHWNVAPPVIE